MREIILANLVIALHYEIIRSILKKPRWQMWVLFLGLMAVWASGAG